MIAALIGLVLVQQGKIIYKDEDANRQPPYVRSPQAQTTFPGSLVSGVDPLFVIQAVNSLVPMGEKRILKTIRDFDQYFVNLWEMWSPVWISRILFSGKTDDYVWPELGGGQIREGEQGITRNWPTYPSILVDDVPLRFHRWPPMMGGGGMNEDGLFAQFLDRNQANWAMRRKVLIPPEDPFLVFDKWFALPHLPIKRDDWSDDVRRQLVDLTRTVFHPKRYRRDRRTTITEAMFDQCHQEFLRLGGHWDRRLNLYVRRDRSFDKDEMAEVSMVGYEFQKINGLRVTVGFKHEQRDVLTITIDRFEEPGRSTSTAVLVAIDPVTGSEIDWMPVNSPLSDNRGDSTKEQRLAEPQHGGNSVPHRTAVELKLEIGRAVVFELHFDGKVFKTPTILPY